MDDDRVAVDLVDDGAEGHVEVVAHAADNVDLVLDAGAADHVVDNVALDAGVEDHVDVLVVLVVGVRKTS